MILAFPIRVLAAVQNRGAPPVAELGFSGDEVFLLIVSGIICLVGLSGFLRTIQVSAFGSPPSHRFPLYISCAASFFFLLLATGIWADKEVRMFPPYIFLVMAMGGAHLTLASWVFPWMGISMREDAFERRNPAAVVSLSGAVVGVMLIYTFANVGAGPSFWNNVFSAGLGALAWFGCWLALELSSGLSDSITVERDLASGIRMAGFLAASGLILGRALAGDWHSEIATISDFVRDGWPVLILLMAEVLAGRKLRPGVSNPIPPWKTSGLAMASAYFLFAFAWVLHLGWWEGAPK